MRRARSDRDLSRVVQLLETLRETDAGAAFSVEAAVARRLRSGPAARAWTPVVSFKEFVWGTAAAMAMLLLGATGLVAVFSPEWLSSPSAAAGGLASIGRTVIGAFSGLVRSAIHVALDGASRLSGAAPYFDSTLTAAGQAALLVCVAMLVLTVLVVSHETRDRRIIG